jgi:hypothetical protein
MNDYEAMIARFNGLSSLARNPQWLPEKHSRVQALLKELKKHTSVVRLGPTILPKFKPKINFGLTWVEFSRPTVVNPSLIGTSSAWFDDYKRYIEDAMNEHIQAVMDVKMLCEEYVEVLIATFINCFNATQSINRLNNVSVVSTYHEKATSDMSQAVYEKLSAKHKSNVMAYVSQIRADVNSIMNGGKFTESVSICGAKPGPRRMSQIVQNMELPLKLQFFNRQLQLSGTGTQYNSVPLRALFHIDAGKIFESINKTTLGNEDWRPHLELLRGNISDQIMSKLAFTGNDYRTHFCIANLVLTNLQQVHKDLDSTIRDSLQNTGLTDYNARIYNQLKELNTLLASVNTTKGNYRDPATLEQLNNISVYIELLQKRLMFGDMSYTQMLDPKIITHNVRTNWKLDKYFDSNHPAGDYIRVNLLVNAVNVVVNYMNQVHEKIKTIMQTANSWEYSKFDAIGDDRHREHILTSIIKWDLDITNLVKDKKSSIYNLNMARMKAQFFADLGGIPLDRIRKVVNNRSDDFSEYAMFDERVDMYEGFGGGSILEALSRDKRPDIREKILTNDDLLKIVNTIDKSKLLITAEYKEVLCALAHLHVAESAVYSHDVSHEYAGKLEKHVIQSLRKLSGFPLKLVYVMDASDASNASNASTYMFDKFDISVNPRLLRNDTIEYISNTLGVDKNMLVNLEYVFKMYADSFNNSSEDSIVLTNNKDVGEMLKLLVLTSITKLYIPHSVPYTAVKLTDLAPNDLAPNDLVSNLYNNGSFACLVRIARNFPEFGKMLM